MAINTMDAAQAHRPDVVTLPWTDAIPEALINTAATLVTAELDGDAPVARIPWVDDAGADFVPEGTEIEEATPELGETIIYTRKIAQLTRISTEQYHQASTASLLSNSMSSAVAARANTALVQETGGTGKLTGLVNTPGILTGETIGTNIDPLIDLFAQIQANGSANQIILASPTAWAGLRKVKVQDGSAVGLLGAGATDAAPVLLNAPVTVTNAVPAGKMLIVDPAAVASAVSPVQVATSEDAYFASDSVGLRITWRLGWGVMKPERLGLITVAGTETGDDTEGK